MKPAGLSDIHANIQARDACLAGWFVGYGADLVAVLQRVQALAGQGALLVKGKHDEMAVRPPAESKTGGGSTTDWTHAQLGSSQSNFLDNLPLLREHGSMALVPATQLGPPAPWPYVTDQRAAAASLDALSWPEIGRVFGGYADVQA